MNTDSFFVMSCVSMIALLFGMILTLGGYRFFMFLLPIWGFFFGFSLGAQTIQAILGTALLGDVTSWVVGFVVAVLFAVLSYLFYFIAVAILAGSLGYSLGVGIMFAITPNLTLVVWVVGLVVAIIFAVATILLNIQKIVVIIATALLGAGVVVGTFLFIFGQLPTSELIDNPVQVALQDSPFWAIIFVVIAIVGAASQFAASRKMELEAYNRWQEIYVTNE